MEILASVNFSSNLLCSFRFIEFCANDDDDAFSLFTVQVKLLYFLPPFTFRLSVIQVEIDGYEKDEDALLPQ